MAGSYWDPRSLILFIFLIFIIILITLLIYGGIHKSFLSEQIEDVITQSGDNSSCVDEYDCSYHGECWGGKCVCNEDYKGIYCNTSIECEIGFESDEFCSEEINCCGEHGECWYGKCLCTDGWYGDNCEYPPLCPNITNQVCFEHEECTYGICWYGKCFCENPNYWGDLCNLQRRDLSYCNDDIECLNGGICIPNNHGNGECYCPIYTNGNTCEILL